MQPDNLNRQPWVSSTCNQLDLHKWIKKICIMECFCWTNEAGSCLSKGLLMPTKYWNGGRDRKQLAAALNCGCFSAATFEPTQLYIICLTANQYFKMKDRHAAQLSIGPPGSNWIFKARTVHPACLFQCVEKTPFLILGPYTSGVKGPEIMNCADMEETFGRLASMWCEGRSCGIYADIWLTGWFYLLK